MRNKRRIKDEMDFFRKAYSSGVIISDCRGFSRMFSRLDNGNAWEIASFQNGNGIASDWIRTILVYHYLGTFAFIAHLNTVSPLV